MTKKVLVGIPSYSSTLNLELVKFLDNIQIPEWRGLAKCYVTRTPIHMARNMILQETLKWWFDYVIMIDDDQYPEKPDCFLKLLQAGEDMVSGVVRLRIKKENLNILKDEIYEDEGKNGMIKYVNYTDCPNRWLFQIGNAWSWLICLSRKVVEHMTKIFSEPFESKQNVYIKLDDWTREELGYNKPNMDMSTEKPIMCKRTLSEDYLFFERAKMLWYKLWCHWDCRCLHLWEPEVIKV